jgi:hypothetical protein
VLGAALRTRTASELLTLITGADADGEALLAAEAEVAALQRAVPRWRDRLGEIPSMARLAAWQDSGLRLVMPGDAEWPTQLDDLGDARPLVLWLRGAADLRLTCVNSVAIVGSRAATGYGKHVAIELAAVLAERGIGVVSGGAYTTKSQLRAQPLSDLGRPVLPNRECRVCALSCVGSYVSAPHPPADDSHELVLAVVVQSLCGELFGGGGEVSGGSRLPWQRCRQHPC